MSNLKLIKTIGGNNGSPKSCGCGSIHFIKAGPAWHCSQCGIYFPVSLGVKKLSEDLIKLQGLRKEFKKAVDDLEKIITE